MPFIYLLIYFCAHDCRLRAENLEAAAKGVQSKQEADPFSRLVFLELMFLSARQERPQHTPVEMLASQPRFLRCIC